MITSQKDCLLPLGISETGRDLKIVCERENLGIRPVYVGIYSSSSLDTTLSNNIFLVLYLIRTKLLKDSQFCCALERMLPCTHDFKKRYVTAAQSRSRPQRSLLFCKYL